MKKYISVIASSLLAVSIAACGETPAETPQHEVDAAITFSKTIKAKDESSQEYKEGLVNDIMPLVVELLQNAYKAHQMNQGYNNIPLFKTESTLGDFGDQEFGCYTDEGLSPEASNFSNIFTVDLHRFITLNTEKTAPQSVQKIEMFISSSSTCYDDKGHYYIQGLDLTIDNPATNPEGLWKTRTSKYSTDIYRYKDGLLNNEELSRGVKLYGIGYENATFTINNNQVSFRGPSSLHFGSGNALAFPSINSVDMNVSIHNGANNEKFMIINKLAFTTLDKNFELDVNRTKSITLETFAIENRFERYLYDDLEGAKVKNAIFYFNHEGEAYESFNYDSDVGLVVQHYPVR